MTRSNGNIHVVVGLPHSAGLTGAPRRALDLCTVLRSSGLRVTVIALRQSPASQEAERRGLDTLHISSPEELLSGGGKFLKALKALAAIRSVFLLNLRVRRELIRLGADIVWVRGAKGIGLYALAARLAKVPLVWDVTYEQASGLVIRVLQRFGLATSSLVVAQYKAGPERIFGQHFARRYASKIETLTPGINLSRLNAYRARRTVRTRTPSMFTLLHVGTLTPRKGQMLALESIDVLRERNPNMEFRVLLAGGTHDPVYEKKLRQYCRNTRLEGLVEFLGWQDDVQMLMVDADVLILPSGDEGVPNSIQEAMYIGLPVVASSAGGIPDILKHNETGWVVRDAGPTTWAKQLEKVYKDRESTIRLSKRAQQYAEDHFDVNSWGCEYARLLHSVASVGITKAYDEA